MFRVEGKTKHKLRKVINPRFYSKVKNFLKGQLFLQYVVVLYKPYWVPYEAQGSGVKILLLE